MDSINSIKDDHTVVHYRLTLGINRVKLRLWELVPSSNSQNQQNHPYLYAANWRFQHLSEAKAFLRDYLRANGATELPESEFPTEGKVAIPSLTTWGSEA